MTCTKFLSAIGFLAFANSALAQDSGATYGLNLAHGEFVIETYNAPPVVRVPATAAPDTAPYTGTQDTPPPVEIDRVTGLPRNTTGWSGDTSAPAGIGCFPQGVCTHLN